MRKPLARPLVVFLLLSGYVCAQQPGEGMWEKYRSGTLSGVIRAHSNRVEPRDGGVDLGSDPVRARATYTGRSRPTPATKQRFIAFYMASLEVPEVAKRFGTEALFVEAGTEFWLPVHERILPDLRKELTVGESVTLFANWIGITYPGRSRRGLHVFLVNEFEKSGASRAARTAIEGWKTLTRPDEDFIVDFPAEPRRDEFRGKPSSGRAGRLIRRYFAHTDSLLLAVSFQDLEYPPNSPFADRVASTYEEKIKEVARRDGWKVVRIRRLSNSVAETEAWDRAGASGGYVHAISRAVVRNGQAYDLQCRSMFIGLEVDRAACDRFFNSFRVIGPSK